ncbi:MAG TPA: RNA polymerase sigma factor [Gemmataceae bacterium]|jgi:RNA polymerase sigma-70 factor (ECF subfamily)|nr:RNA polymerase sigma factor [Gemmataceae bacterium]
MNDPAPVVEGRSVDATSLSLLQRVRDQDRTAWERFVHLYEPVVRRWCERAGLQPSDAADLTQDLFHTVLTRLDTFRHDQPGASFRGWLWTITRNRVALHFRKQAAQPRPAGGDSAFLDLATPTDDSTAPPESKAEVVRRALELIRPEFEPATWQAFWKVQVEDQPVAATAAALGLSANAVYKARARVLRRLRDEFGELID